MKITDCVKPNLLNKKAIKIAEKYIDEDDGMSYAAYTKMDDGGKPFGAIIAVTKEYFLYVPTPRPNPYFFYYSDVVGVGAIKGILFCSMDVTCEDDRITIHGKKEDLQSLTQALLDAIAGYKAEDLNK